MENITDAAAFNFISAYNGNFSFLLSLKAQYMRYKKLSTAQISGIKKCMIREQEFQAKKAAQENGTYVFDESKATIKRGVVFSVGRYFGTELAKKVGLPHQHRQFEVLNIKAETNKGYLLNIKAVGRRSSSCSVCGRTLTDAYSVQHGIGPICAERYGLTNVEQLDLMLTEQAQPVETWLPKAALRNRSDVDATQHEDVENVDAESQD